MEQDLALRLSRQLKISLEQVVREHWEIVILKGIFESPAGKFLIFKGGTALRLAYQSPRFSEDLDFLITEDVLRGQFNSFVRKFISPYPVLTVTDLKEKHFTYLAEIKVSVTYLSIPFRIKIEISKRADRDYQKRLTLLSSPASPLQVLGQVATLDQIYQDKKACIRERTKSRDLFDLWYISQKLSLPFVPEKHSIPRKELLRDLRKYLPRDFWKVIDELAAK
ncbi:MAG TPA: hypothetical protein EYP53_08470 [Candidatus Latescibacteria bacterium]|nr:hypothetical protein [Candidatus Latescibacterota bacterium]